MLSRVSTPLRQSLRLARPYSTTSALFASRKPPSTSSADLHDLPKSVKSAASPSSSPSASPSRTDASGNSTAPEDISSRPAGPGPSGPVVDPAVAAPDTVSRGSDEPGSSCGNHNAAPPGAAMRNAMKGHEARKKGPNPREEGGWN